MYYVPRLWKGYEIRKQYPHTEMPQKALSCERNYGFVFRKVGFLLSKLAAGTGCERSLAVETEIAKTFEQSWVEISRRLNWAKTQRGAVEWRPPAIQDGRQQWRHKPVAMATPRPHRPPHTDMPSQQTFLSSPLCSKPKNFYDNVSKALHSMYSDPLAAKHIYQH